MAYEFKLDNRTFEASADLSASQYRFVTQDANDRVVAATTAGEAIVGVLQNDPDALGRAATVAVGGISKVEAGEAIAVGDAISTDNVGRAKTAVATEVVVGYARTAGAEAGVLVAVELTQPQVRVAS